MSKLWVPPAVSRELSAKTEAHKMEVMRAAHRDATLDYWDKELQKIDPLLTLVKASENAEVPGLKPGYWHVIRENENGGPPSILPIVGDDGEYVEPTSRLLDLLRAGDLRNPRAIEERRRKDEQAEKARIKQEEEDHNLRVEEMMDRWRAATQTSVSMTDQPWTQTATAKRAARKKA